MANAVLERSPAAVEPARGRGWLCVDPEAGFARQQTSNRSGAVAFAMPLGCAVPARWEFQQVWLLPS